VGAPSCVPPSGSTFALGTTTVNCNVSDASGNPASCSFTVTVTPPSGNELSVDDGSFESVLGLTGGGTTSFVNRLTPTSYPATVSSLKIFFANFGGLSVGASVSLLVGNNADGDTNINNTVFQTTPATVQALGQYTTYDVPDVTITSGDFVVGFRLTYAAGVLPCAQDRTPPSQQRSYLSTDAAGATFIIVDTIGPDFTGNFGIRALTQTPATGLQYYPLPFPVRLLDTRPGEPACYTPGQPIPGGASRTQPARGVCNGLTIPANAAAITGNITTVQSGGGFLTLYPSDAERPLVSNSNFNPNEIINNVFTVGLGAADGAFKVFVLTTTDVVVDVTGYYAPPGAGGLYFHPLPRPVRLLETRAGEPGCYTPGAPLPGNFDSTQQATGVCDGLTIPSAARAIVGNATTVNPGGGFLTLFPADATRPLVASSNYGAGQIMNAPFTVGLSPTGAFKIYPLTQTDLVVDVLGYYSPEATDVNGAGLLFNPLAHPVRLLETRNDPASPGCYKTNAPLQGGVVRTQPARGVCDGLTIASNALGIVGNATVVNANGGFLTFWPSDAARPLVATSNFTPGQIFNRHFTVGLSAGAGAFNIFALLTTDLVIDVSGYFAP
jgi:hypothetical protein